MYAWRASATRSITADRLVPLLVLVLAATSGLLTAMPGKLAAILPFDVPISWLVALGGIALLALVGVRRPLVVYGSLLVSMPLSDLARKLGNGDPRITLARDVLLMVATIVLTIHCRPWSSVVRAFRGWWLALLLCVAYFMVASVHSAFVDWRLPLSAMHLYFGFLPLVAAGWYVGQDRQRLRTAVAFGSIVLCVVTVVGIVQGLVGPSFLAPRSAPSAFERLALERSTVGQTAANVFQPTGFFVEPGRFANWVFVTFVVGVALLHQHSLKRWRYPVAVIGVLGLLIASNRTIIVSSAALVAFLVLRHVRVDGRRAGRMALGLLVAVAVTVLALQFFVPSIVSSRLQFLGLSLNPASASSELSNRAPGYVQLTALSVRVGGAFGRGLGSQSLGRQYINTPTTFQTFGEGGFVTVAVETGLIGLLIWVTWTALWVRRLHGMARAAPHEVAGAVATIAGGVTMLWFINFWIAVGAVQDYVVNAAAFFGCGLAVALAASDHRGDSRPGRESDATHEDATDAFSNQYAASSP